MTTKSNTKKKPAKKSKAIATVRLKKVTKQVEQIQPTRRGMFPTHDQYKIRNQDATQLLSALSIQRRPIDFKPTGIATDEVVKMALALDKQMGGAFNISAQISPQLVGWYGSQSFIGYQMCAILMQHWLVDKACTIPARDAIRNGFKITSNDGSDIPSNIYTYINKLNKKYSLNRHLLDFVRIGKCFGIRIAMFKIASADKHYYEKPFNIDGVEPGSYQGIVQIDPYWITPELDYASAADASSLHFYEPTFWRVNGGLKVHRSHLVIYKTGEVPDILKPTYFYGGVPLPQRIYERVYCADRTANEAPQLAMTKRLTVYKAELTSGIANQSELEEKLQIASQMRDNYGYQVIGSTEAIEQHDISIADFDKMTWSQYQLASAIANIPATKMYGLSPRGFGATGEYEVANYHEELESIQEHDLTPLVDRHLAIMMKSDITPKKGISFTPEIVWEPLDTPTTLETEQANYLKAQTDEKYVSMGAVDAMDVHDKLLTDEQSGYNGLDLEEPTVAPTQTPPPLIDQPAANDNLKNLTGRQHQNITRIIKKFSDGALSQSAASTLLKNGFGLTDKMVADLLGLKPVVKKSIKK